MNLSIEFANALRAGRGSRLRGLLEFAREEIVVPDGPFRGRRFDTRVQPYTRLLFEQLDGGEWRRSALLGPTQSGKTLAGFVIPVLWHLFELGETVIIGAPSVAMLLDKWLVNLLPVIKASRYASRMPTRGSGSDGGESHIYDFGGGAVLRFMAAAGGDKSRAGFTSRVVYITETDGMDTIKEGSRESDPITQLEQRTKAFGARARVAMECTVSSLQGRIWQEYLRSTRSRIVSACPACGAWICPEREHLVGWKGCKSIVEAQQAAHWRCPACAAAIGESERREMVQGSRVLHHGQDLVGGAVTGEAPLTDTLGFRWNAWHNLFVTTEGIAGDEWNASQKTEEAAIESAERDMMQSTWVVPVKLGPKDEGAGADVEVSLRVDTSLARGAAPPWTKVATLGIDVGKHALHWVATAWREDATGHTVAYGVQDVDAAALGEERAILQALRAVRDMALPGWPAEGGKVHRPTMLLVDSGYRDDIVMQFCADRESKGLCWASKGRGVGQDHQTYNRPRASGGAFLKLGDEWHLELLEGKGYLVMFNANFWKSWFRARVQAPRSESGAWTIHAPLAANDHFSYGKHLSSERLVETWDPKKGMVERWEARRTANHWLDATVLTCVAASACGVSPTRALGQGTTEKPPLQPGPSEPSVASPIPTSPAPSPAPGPLPKPVRKSVSSPMLR